MASTGNVFVATGENLGGIGDTVWTNPGNIVSDNATDATIVATTGSNYLVARNANLLSVPTNSEIKGITVRIEASEHTAGTEVLTAQLQNESGTLFGATKTATISGTSKAVYTYGGVADLWSATLTGNIIHDADFGCRFWFTTTHDIRVDFVTIAVEYIVPPPGVSTETDTALALTRVKLKPTGIGSETDAALALTPSKITATGLAAETDTALAPLVENQGGLTVGMATETDATLALGIAKIISVGRADETDTALAPLVGGLRVGQANETDTAIPLGVVKFVVLGLALETDEALAPGISRQYATGMAAETDTALGLAVVKRRSVGLATEKDEARALQGTSTQNLQPYLVAYIWQRTG